MRHRSSLAVAVLAFAYLWSYPLVIGRADESHFLYGARRVLDGQVLYRDFFEILTPLGYYLFAGVYRLAGTTLAAARTAIALVEAVGCAVLFALARRVASPLEATVAALVFAALCVPAWPYASPHWLSTTLGLVIAAVALADGWAASSRARPFAAGVLGGVAICVQQQRGAFAAAWLPLAFAVLALGRPRGARLRTAVAEMAWSVAGGALVTGLVLGWAAWRASPPAVVEAIYGFARNNYAPSTAGTIAWAEVVALTRGWLAYTWLPLLRIAPLFLLLDGISIVRVLAGARARADLVNAAIWLLATVMALSIWYLPDFIHVSFVLPFLLLPAARLVHALRTWRGWSGVPAVSRTLAAAVAVAGLAVVVKAGANLARIHASAPRTFDTAFGRLRGDAAMEALFRAVRDHAVPERDGRRLLFSYPDDAWLYLTLPADDPMRFSVLVPGFFPAEDVAEAVAVIEARRPGTIVLLAAFADDPVGRAVRARYRPVAELPPYRIFVRPDAD